MKRLTGLAFIVSGLLFFHGCASTSPNSQNTNLNSNSTSNNNQASEAPEPAEYEEIRRKLAEGGATESAIRDNIQDVDPKITYEQVKKNADKYIGKSWAFKGKIYSIYEKDGQTNSVISLDPWGNKLIWVIGDFTTDFVEKNQVFVVGYITGNYSYKSIAGWDITVPAVAARAMLKPNDAAKIRAKK
jgi:hypothetical protein